MYARFHLSFAIQSSDHNPYQRLGGTEKLDEDRAIHDAVELARSSDAVVVIGGLTPEWESEGFDRKTLALPMNQDRLVDAIADGNPSTIVVIQAVVPPSLSHEVF